MPYSKLTNEQIRAVVAAQEIILTMPGVTMLSVDFADREKTQSAIIVYVDHRDRSSVIQIPTSVSGVPVIVMIENRMTFEILEIIDPRGDGGESPAPPHNGANAVSHRDASQRPRRH